MNTLHERRMSAILACLLLILLMALTGCGGGDASADEVSEHDRQTTQPVDCAASIALMGWGIDTIRAELARWSKA